ncbi:hypothetical protein [Roseomonas sp. HF4]|uniref:hypothetical protein n=1 Tax=Roseomonas sp. HF4 TaxID=2562313 RepID=UPI00148571D5|nr:hypothetical protein [Roseomonas sp. HF4]
MKSRLAGLLGRFMTPAQSADPLLLGEFIRAQGAYVAQKTVLDYCRVKSGRHEEKLFSEPMFRAALDHCRWQVFFGALADVTAVSEAWLRPYAPERAETLLEALARLHDSALMADPPPEAERQTIDGFSIRHHLAGLQISPPARSNEMPLLAEAPLFATLPIHPDQRRGEAPSIRGALRFHLVSARQEMERRFDAPRLAARLVAED